MNFESSKIALAQLILSSENPKLITRIMELFKSEDSDFWLELTAEQQADIKKGISELDKGEKVKWTDLRDSA